MVVIVVTGATGKVGRHLVADLVSAGAPVRALTRTPTRAHLPAEAQVMRFDSGRAADCLAAVSGATSVFINVTAVGGSMAGMMTAAADAAVRTAVMLSSLPVRDDGPQPYALGAHHKALEDTVVGSGLEWTMLRCGGFAANTLAWAPSIRQAGLVRAPYEDAATARIAEHDVAAAAAAVLLGDGHADSRYVLTGDESLTQVEQTNAIGTAIARTLRFEELSPDAFRQAAAAYMSAAAIEDVLRYLAAHVGRPAEMSPDFEKLTGRAPTTTPVRSTTVKVLVIGHLTRRDIGRYLQAEGQRVAELRAEGVTRDVFLKADRSGPILVLNDTTAAKAREQLATLPFVEHALVAFEYIELNDL